ncbi:UNVERIFIED_CONTAM: hypothetical protein FKN15_035165 [Acipenser sinensis]
MEAISLFASQDGKSQQKCIVVFALVCCFAVLVALIFSAVDIWGEDEDGITEDNCSKNCRIVLVENIPEDLSYSDNGTAHLSLYQGLLSLLDSAEKTVEIVSSHWALNNIDLEQSHPSTWQSKQLFKRLRGLQSQEKNLKIASDLKQKDSKELKVLEASAKAKHGNVRDLSIMSKRSEVGSEDFDTSDSDADLSLSDDDEEDVEPRTVQTVQTEEHAATL